MSTPQRPSLTGPKVRSISDRFAQRADVAHQAAATSQHHQQAEHQRQVRQQQHLQHQTTSGLHRGLSQSATSFVMGGSFVSSSSFAMNPPENSARSPATRPVVQLATATPLRAPPLPQPTVSASAVESPNTRIGAADGPWSPSPSPARAHNGGGAPTGNGSSTQRRRRGPSDPADPLRPAVLTGVECGHFSSMPAGHMSKEELAAARTAPYAVDDRLREARHRQQATGANRRSRRGPDLLESSTSDIDVDAFESNSLDASGPSSNVRTGPNGKPLNLQEALLQCSNRDELSALLEASAGEGSADRHSVSHSALPTAMLRAFRLHNLTADNPVVHLLRDPVRGPSLALLEAGIAANEHNQLQPHQFFQWCLRVLWLDNPNFYRAVPPSRDLLRPLHTTGDYFGGHPDVAPTDVFDVEAVARTLRPTHLRSRSSDRRTSQALSQSQRPNEDDTRTLLLTTRPKPEALAVSRLRTPAEGLRHRLPAATSTSTGAGAGQRHGDHSGDDDSDSVASACSSDLDTTPTSLRRALADAASPSYTARRRHRVQSADSVDPDGGEDRDLRAILATVGSREEQLALIRALANHRRKHLAHAHQRSAALAGPGSGSVTPHPHSSRTAAAQDDGAGDDVFAAAMEHYCTTVPFTRGEVQAVFQLLDGNDDGLVDYRDLCDGVVHIRSVDGPVLPLLHRFATLVRPRVPRDVRLVRISRQELVVMCEAVTAVMLRRLTALRSARERFIGRHRLTGVEGPTSAMSVQAALASPFLGPVEQALLLEERASLPTPRPFDALRAKKQLLVRFQARSTGGARLDTQQKLSDLMIPENYVAFKQTAEYRWMAALAEECAVSGAGDDAENERRRQAMMAFGRVGAIRREARREAMRQRLRQAEASCPSVSLLTLFVRLRQRDAQDAAAGLPLREGAPMGLPEYTVLRSLLSEAKVAARNAERSGQAPKPLPRYMASTTSSSRATKVQAVARDEEVAACATNDEGPAHEFLLEGVDGKQPVGAPEAHVRAVLHFLDTRYTMPIQQLELTLRRFQIEYDAGILSAVGYEPVSYKSVQDALSGAGPPAAHDARGWLPALSSRSPSPTSDATVVTLDGVVGLAASYLVGHLPPEPPLLASFVSTFYREFDAEETEATFRPMKRHLQHPTLERAGLGKGAPTAGEASSPQQSGTGKVNALSRLTGVSAAMLTGETRRALFNPDSPRVADGEVRTVAHLPPVTIATLRSQSPVANTTATIDAPVASPALDRRRASKIALKPLVGDAVAAPAPASPLSPSANTAHSPVAASPTRRHNPFFFARRKTTAPNMNREAREFDALEHVSIDGRIVVRARDSGNATRTPSRNVYASHSAPLSSDDDP